MAIKILKYVIGEDGIDPAFEKCAGMRYDHKKTQLQFSLEQDFYDKINGDLNGGMPYYRYDCFYGDILLHSTEVKKLNSTLLEPYMLEYWVTKYGGRLTVRVVLTNSLGEYTASEIFNGNVTVYLKDTPDADIDEKQYQSLSTMAISTKNNADIAYKAMQKTTSDLEKTESLRLSLENAEWIFDGNSEIDVDYVVETEFKNESNNALANGVITEKFNEIDEKIETLKKGLAWGTLGELVDAIKNEIFLESHPIGSYYWSSEPTSPADLFGGYWKQIKDVFVFAAGELSNVGATGGESEHILTSSEMPKHSHGFTHDYFGNGTRITAPSPAGTGCTNIFAGSSGSYHPGHWADLLWGTTKTGGSQAHNNMPPYITAYCWQRVEEGEDE